MVYIFSYHSKMVSLGKRSKYVFENTSSSDTDNSEETFSHTRSNSLRKQTNVYKNSEDTNTHIRRKPKCFSKNALMARENRLKKKMYVSNLESDVSRLKRENKKLVAVAESQSRIMSTLKNEINYLKNVLANSSDICKLVRSIQQNTGMSVTTSLDNKLSFDNCISKPTTPVSRKTAHPWEEESNSGECCMFSSNDPQELDFGAAPQNIFPDLDIDCNLDDSLDTHCLDKQLENIMTAEKIDETYNIPSEHNYTFPETAPDEQVGVCLHVSKHRVSLEFCAECNSNAVGHWKG